MTKPKIRDICQKVTNDLCDDEKCPSNYGCEYAQLIKAGFDAVIEYLNGRCEHTTDPIQLRRLCNACRKDIGL
jgi:hypothetical protein